MSTTIFTNVGRNAIAEALSTDKRLTIARVAFGDKGVTPNSIHAPNSQGLMNERFRMNVDNVYYPTVSDGNNAIVKVTATLTPEQASNMEPITVREFGLIDSTGNFIILGTTVTTLTKEDGNGNGISFDLSIALPSPDKIVNIVLNPNDSDFSEGYRLKLLGIEERATKNKSDSFLTNRANHTGKQAINTITNLEEELASLNTLMNSKTSKFKGMFLNHADFLNSLRVFENGEEPEAGNITDSKIEDNYFNGETKSVWYYKGENVWLDSNEHIINSITGNTMDLDDINENLNEMSIKIDNSTSLGIFETVVDLPVSPNFNTETNEYDEVIYNAFAKDTKSTWWYIPEKDSVGAVIGGNWVESTGDLDNKLENKVDKISGKTLTTNDFTTALKNKLNGIEDNAQVNPTIVNNLISTDTDKTLAANQGYVLKGYIDNLNIAITSINEILTSDDTTLDELQEIVNYIKSNKTVLETLAITNIAGLETALAGKQSLLKSGNNIKTINDNSLLGSGNIDLGLSNYTLNSQFNSKAETVIRNFLPSGLKGELPFVKNNGTNDLQMDTLVKFGHFAYDSAQLDQTKDFVKSFKQIFNTWKRFSHNATQKQPANPSEIDAWQYNETTKSIVQPLNTTTFVGFASTEYVDDYDHEVILKSSNSDDDNIGLLLAFSVDENGREYTLSVIINRGGYSPKNYGVVYNYARSDYKLIVNGTSKTPLTTDGGWATQTAGIRVRVQRRGTIFTITRSAWGTDNALVPDTKLEFDLKSDPLLHKFQGKTRYGYVAYSQSNSTFEIVEGVKTFESMIFDLSTGNIQEFKAGSWQINIAEKMQNYISPGRLLYNKHLEKLFYYVGDVGTVPTIIPITLK